MERMKWQQENTALLTVLSPWMYDYGLLAACYPSLFAKNVRVSKHTLLPRRSVRAWIRGRKLYTPAQDHLRAPAVLAARFCALRSWGSAFLCFSLLARQQVREKTAGWEYLKHEE